jgi:iron complex outermembrane receptor protein
MKEIVDMLREGKYSCVIRNGEIRTFTRPGVIDAYCLLKNEPAFLKGASVADKVVGKGAAALFALGEVSELYADVISTPALDLLKKTPVKALYREEVPAIKNKLNTGLCPLEAKCAGKNSAADILPLIDDFMKEKLQNKCESVVEKVELQFCKDLTPCPSPKERGAKPQQLPSCTDSPLLRRGAGGEVSTLNSQNKV